MIDKKGFHSPEEMKQIIRDLQKEVGDRGYIISQRNRQIVEQEKRIAELEKQLRGGLTDDRNI